MTYGVLKNLVTGLLMGDNVIPKDDEVIKALLSYAFNMVSNKAEALHLLTLNKNDDILRMGTGDYLVRTPELPVLDSDELDIDHELGFAAARYMAAMISKEKAIIHQQYGDDEILKYNGKVYQILEKIRIDSESCDENTQCAIQCNC